MLRAEERRLQRVLLRALALSMSAPLGALACSSGGDDAPSLDASMAPIDAAPVDSAADAVLREAMIAPDVEEVDASLLWCDAGAPQIVDAGLLDDGACNYVVDSRCGLPVGWRDDGYGTLDGVTCIEICPRATNLLTSCEVFYGQDTVPDSAAPPGDASFDAASTEGGEILVECNLCGAGGRRPEGYRSSKIVRSRSLVGALFAHLAGLESASIAAFRRLERELVAHGAPRDLVAGARRAARDEARHTRAMARLARRWGATPSIPGVGRLDVRPLEDVALENAVEGCVRETYGALLAHWQSAHATDASIAKAMKRIAVDETRHAALAWGVARWVDGELGRAARARVRRARRSAMDALEGERRAPVSSELVTIAGVPRRADAARLVAALRASLRVPALPPRAPAAADDACPRRTGP
jgi:hypothetical protein